MSGCFFIWVFPKIGVPQNGWFIIENPIKMDDLGVPLFLETSCCNFLRFDCVWLICVFFCIFFVRCSELHYEVFCQTACLAGVCFLEMSKPETVGVSG